MTTPKDEIFPSDVCPSKEKTPRVLKSGEHDMHSRTADPNDVKKDLKNS
ncbi:MAG: hypothetical protein IJG50_03620 [Clostridia bacterium]|nr:hypothetical protein [Clostridia bacterium]